MVDASSDGVMLCQTDVLKRGWTKKLIERFLPAPTLVPNPVSESSSPMKLWTIQQVERAEKNAAFKKALAEVEVQRGYARRYLDKKRQEILGDINWVLDQVEVEVLGQKELEASALYSQQAWYDSKNSTLSVWTASRDSIERWTVNYIRHRLLSYRGKPCTYDRLLRKLKGTAGEKETYAMFHNSVLDLIAEVYPMYKDECDRQKDPVGLDI